MFNDCVKKIFDDYSVEILLDGKRFCSLLADYAAQYTTERKIIKRLESENLLRFFYNILSGDKNNYTVEVAKLIYVMEEAGFSEKWINIAMQAFKLDNNNLQEKSYDKEVAFAAGIANDMKEAGLDDDLIRDGLTSFDLPEGVSNEVMVKNEGKNKEEHKKEADDFRALFDKTLIVTCSKTIEKSQYRGYKDTEVIVIPKGVEIIKQNAFANCSNLKCVFFPRTVKSIAKNAFLNCHNLVFVDYEYTDSLMRSVRQTLNKVDENDRDDDFYVSEDAFSGCDNLLFILGNISDFASTSSAYKNKVILHHDVVDEETDSREIISKFGQDIFEEYFKYLRFYHMITKEYKI